MEITIFHNAHCSKSRKTLELIQEAGVEPRIVAYLDAPPSAETLLHLATLLGHGIGGLLRKGEAEFTEARDLPALDDDEAVADWLARHPRVLQRPIVVREERRQAVIGRPPENVLELLRP